MTGISYFYSNVITLYTEPFIVHVIVQFIYKRPLFCALLLVFQPCLRRLEFVQIICTIYRLLFNMGILTEIALF